MIVATREPYEDDVRMDERRAIRRRQRISHRQKRLLLQLRREANNLLAVHTAAKDGRR